MQLISNYDMHYILDQFGFGLDRNIHFIVTCRAIGNWEPGTNLTLIIVTSF